MGCNCSKNTVSINTVISANRIAQVRQPDENCNVTRENLLSLKEELLSVKTPENAGFVNSQLGLLETMLNYSQYCIYKIESPQ